jgi:hypothetical protein
LAHEGQEPRPNGDYFLRQRHVLMSQGDIHSDVPIWVPPDDALDPGDVSSGEVIVLTASCWVDKQRVESERLLLVAPLFEVDAVPLNAADRNMLTTTDCLHQFMYLPAEGAWPERVVALLHAQPIRFSLLSRCPRQSQLTYRANQQLMRKLTMFYSTAHVPAEQFRPISDDFPEGID